MSKIKDYLISKQEEDLINEYRDEQVELGNPVPDVAEIKRGIIERNKIDNILDEAISKLIPVFDDARSEENFLGIGEVVEKPVNISQFGGRDIGYCKIRFYNSKEEAGHWIDLRYLKGQYESSTSTKELA